MKVRTKIVNKLIRDHGYSTYLEIGVGDKNHLLNVNVPLANKDGIDPVYNTTYTMSSDDAFKKMPSDKKYDLIFVDGMHLKDYVLRDIENSLKHLSIGGTIVCHDCNPPSKKLTSPSPKSKSWFGTSWEAVAELRMTRKDLSITVVDADCGCAIIRPGAQKLFKKAEITYELLEQNRKELLNLISLEEFMLSGL